MIQRLSAAGWTPAQIVSRAALARLPNAWQNQLEADSQQETDIMDYKCGIEIFRAFQDNDTLAVVNEAGKSFSRGAGGVKLRDFLAWARL
jgi:hypothetical protein